MLPEFNDCSYQGSSRPVRRRNRIEGEQKGIIATLCPGLRDVESDELNVVSLSLTRHGVGMELPHDVPVGGVYTIKIGAGGETIQSQVRILSCDPIADGLYRAGGEFC